MRRTQKEAEIVRSESIELAEQRRIVARVDDLMAVLDDLAATLATAQATALSAARTTAEKLLAATEARLHAA